MKKIVLIIICCLFSLPVKARLIANFSPCIGVFDYLSEMQNCPEGEDCIVFSGVRLTTVSVEVDGMRKQLCRLESLDGVGEEIPLFGFLEGWSNNNGPEQLAEVRHAGGHVGEEYYFSYNIEDRATFLQWDHLNFLERHDGINFGSKRIVFREVRPIQLQPGIPVYSRANVGEPALLCLNGPCPNDNDNDTSADPLKNVDPLTGTEVHLADSCQLISNATLSYRFGFVFIGWVLATSLLINLRRNLKK